MTQRPTYLAQLPSKALNESALLGIGSALPSHISIRGNTFTLVDASGAEHPAGPVLDVCVADISDVMCKQYYAEKWTPDSKEPPLCWSANGVAPSRDAIEPQSPTCAACPQNVRGSAVSALSGVAVKACRDEKWLAVLVPQIPQVKFQLRLTPGSFKTWQSFVKLCEGNQTELSDVLTRLTFQPATNGVLNFQAQAYISEETAKMRNAGYTEKAFDALVGRNDVPRQAALPAPSPQPDARAVPFAAPSAASPLTHTAPPQAGAQSVPNASLSEPAPARRRRRTAAEMAQAQQPQTPQAQPAPAVAPFRPQAQQLPVATNPQFLGGSAPPPANPAFAAPAGNTGNFGIQEGVVPNPELTAAIDGLFGKK